MIPAVLYKVDARKAVAAKRISHLILPGEGHIDIDACAATGGAFEGEAAAKQSDALAQSSKALLIAVCGAFCRPWFCRLDAYTIVANADVEIAIETKP